MVKDLQKGTSFEFRLTAENEQGEGVPADVGPVVLPAEAPAAKPVKPSIAPTLTIRKPPATISAGHAVDVEITYTGEPRPKLQVLFNSSEVLPSRRVKIDEARRELRSTFTINKAETADSGDYTVVVTNESGSTSAQFTLRILDKASSPRNAQVTEVTEVSATVTWNAPTSDGGTPIKKYTLMKQAAGRTWQHVTTTTERSHKFVDLLAKTKYYFKIVPVTEEGEGEAAELGPVSVRGKIAALFFKLSSVLYSHSTCNFAVAPKEEKQIKSPQKTPQQSEANDNTDKQPQPPISTKPEISITKPAEEVSAGDNVEIVITMSGEPIPSLTIFRNGAELTESRKVRIEEKRRGVRFVLTLAKVDQTDTGTYTIKAKNPGGEASVDFTLKVVSKASPPQNLVASDVTSESATLSWLAPVDDGGKPVSGYVVYKRQANRTTWQKITKVTSTATKTTVTELQPSSTYDFRVVALTDVGEGEPAEVSRVRTEPPKNSEPQSRRGSSVVEAVATEKPKTKPTITMNKSEMTTTTSQIVQFTANFTGEPRPTISWYRNNVFITQSVHHQIDERRYDTVASLTINKTEMSDTGTYKVKAKNEVGETWAEFTLRVLSKASKPENLTATEVTNTSVTLTFDLPKTDGGTPIKHFIVEKRSAGRASWTRTTTTKTTTVTITELTDETKYDFRVRAETDQGEGEAAELEDIKTKSLEKKTKPELEKAKAEAAVAKPTVTVSKTQLKVGVNQMMQLDVSFTGQPRPTLTWSHDGVSIDNSRRIRFEERRFDMTCAMTIRKTESGDSGTYTVTARNEGGEATAEFTLVTVGKAGPPRNLVESDVTPVSCTLKWEPPLKDGGTPIKHFIVEKRSAGRTSW